MLQTGGSLVAFFSRIRSPGSTIETKSKSITEEYWVRSGDNEPNREAQVG